MSMPGEPTVTLPPGVSVTAFRETSQSGPFGQITQGATFALDLGSGQTTTIFIPNSDLSNASAVSAAIAARVSAIRGILNAGS